MTPTPTRDRAHPRGKGWRGRCSAGLGFLLLGLAAIGVDPDRAALQPQGEYHLKGVFLFNFLQFVEWPAAAHASPDSPIVIGIVGEDPFGASLDGTVEGEKVNGRSLVVRRFKPDDDVMACHLLFLSSTLKEQTGDLLRKLQGHPVLTVGETPGFAERGGVMNFVMVRSKVRFEANPRAAARQGLRLSSKLLSLSRVVEGGVESGRK